MDSLLSKPTPGDIKKALKNMPRGIGGLDTMYEQAMKRIKDQNEELQELAMKVLSWVTHAKRPLTILELQHALAAKDGTVELDEDFVPEVEDLVSFCAGLVTVDKQSDLVRWIHYTTQEYFEQAWTKWIPSAQVDVASTCLTYLLFDCFEAGFCLTDEYFKARLQLNPFYDYAARNWGYHAYIASKEVQRPIMNLLENESKVSSASQAMLAFKDYYGNLYSQMVPRGGTGVHLVAYFGLSEAMAVLIKKGHNPSAIDSMHRTPLSWAAAMGHEAVVRLLLAEDGVDPDSKDGKGRTPLCWSARNGHEAVVRLLLAKDGVDPDSKDSRGSQTPLSWAAENGHKAVVRLLLANDSVDVDSKDSLFGRTPLSWAAENGHEAVIRMLLAKDGVDLDSKSDGGMTPLSWAAENGHEAVVRLLLANDSVDVDSKDSLFSRTPLSWAAAKGHEAVVKLLLSKDGVDLNSKDGDGRTPLLWAAGIGHKACRGPQRTGARQLLSYCLPRAASTQTPGTEMAGRRCRGPQG
jgi:ankyrin repeat protein